MAKRLSAVSLLTIRDVTRLTVAQAAQGTQLSALLKHEQGEIYQIAFVSKAIKELSTLVRLEADADTIIFWAELIAKEFWQFKAEEMLKAFLNGARKMGKTYSPVKFNDLTGWLDDYAKIKDTHSETEALRNKETYDPTRLSLKDDTPKHINVTESDLKALGHFKNTNTQK